jgi:hypothetical protein
VPAGLREEGGPVSVDTAPEVGATPPPGLPARPRFRLRRRRTAIGLVVVLLLLGVAAFAWWPSSKADVRAGTTLVTADGMAARYGIDVTLIGVTAAGGLIDFRFQVVDPDKADALLHDPDLHPVLVVEDTGETLVMTTPPHHHATDLQLGGTYFFLLANAHNAIHRGSLLTLVIGDVRLEHIEAHA